MTRSMILYSCCCRQTPKAFVVAFAVDPRVDHGVSLTDRLAASTVTMSPQKDKLREKLPTKKS